MRWSAHRHVAYKVYLHIEAAKRWEINRIDIARRWERGEGTAQQQAIDRTLKCVSEDASPSVSCRFEA